MSDSFFISSDSNLTLLPEVFIFLQGEMLLKKEFVFQR